MVGIISEDFCRGGVFGVDVASLVFPCAAAGGPAPVCCEVGDASNEKGRGHVLCLHHGFLFAEREGFEPPEPLGSTVFKTAAIDRSAIFPATKVAPYFHFTKFRPGFRPRPSGVRRSAHGLPERPFAAAVPTGCLPVVRVPAVRRPCGRGLPLPAGKKVETDVREIFINFVGYG